MSERYDPQAVEGDVNRGQQYVSKRDVRILVILTGIAVAILYPVYQYGKRESHRAVCSTQMKGIYDAVALYAVGHDEGLPPLYREGADGLPSLDRQGRPYTWISDVAPGMNRRATFVCPAADPSEAAFQEDQTSTKVTVRSTYGMFAPYGGVKTYNVDSPATTALLTETSDRGTMSSFDPVSYGKGVPNGFVVGFDSGDPVPEKDEAKFITRLAYRGTANGQFSEAETGRHDKGNHFITAAGSLDQLKAPVARVRLGPDGYPTGFWRTPPYRGSR